MTKNLIIISSNYPWGLNEKFLADELYNFPNDNKFSEVYLLSTPINSKKRNLPKHIKLIKQPKSITFVDIFESIKNLPYFLTLLKLLLRESKIKKITIKHLFVIYWYFCRLHIFVKSLSGNTTIYTYWFNEKTYAAALLRSSNTIDRLVTRAHGYDFYYERTIENKFPFRDSLIHYIDKLYLLSAQAENYYLQKYTEKCPFEVARLGVNINIDLFNKQQSNEKKTNELHFITCAFYSELKRINYIFDCLCSYAMANQNKLIKWTYIGAGAEATTVLKNFTNILKRKSIANFQLTLPNQQDYTFIKNCYENIWYDAFILLSKTEGVPVSVMEAMSYGIPCITNDVGGLPDIVDDTCGALLNFGIEINQIKDAIEKLTSPKNANSYRIKAYRKILEKYNAAINYPLFYKSL